MQNNKAVTKRSSEAITTQIRKDFIPVEIRIIHQLPKKTKKSRKKILEINTSFNAIETFLKEKGAVMLR